MDFPTMTGLTNLPAHVWRARLCDLHRDSVSSLPEEQEDRIRDAARLLHGHGAIPAAASLPALPFSMARLERMIAADACVNAVLLMMGEEATYLLSRGAGGACLATVISPLGDEETMAEAATPALALLAAWTAALAGIDTVTQLDMGCGIEPCQARLN